MVGTDEGATRHGLLIPSAPGPAAYERGDVDDLLDRAGALDAADIRFALLRRTRSASDFGYECETVDRMREDAARAAHQRLAHRTWLLGPPRDEWPRETVLRGYDMTDLVYMSFMAALGAVMTAVSTATPRTAEPALVVAGCVALTAFALWRVVRYVRAGSIALCVGYGLRPLRHDADHTTIAWERVDYVHLQPAPRLERERVSVVLRLRDPVEDLVLSRHTPLGYARYAAAGIGAWRDRCSRTGTAGDDDAAAVQDG